MTIFLLLLSVLHIPLISFGDDSIGFFDIFFTTLFLIYLLKIRKVYEVKLVTVYLTYIYLCFISTLYLIDLNLNFHLLFLFKQVQYFLVAIVWYIYLSKKDETKNFVNGILLSSLVVSFYGFYGILSGLHLRLHLINKPDYSTNPAGYILSICIIFIFFWGNRVHKLLLVFPLIALILTFSRTNGLALLITIILGLLLRLSFRNIAFSFIGIFIVLFLIDYSLSFFPKDYVYHLSLISYVINPMEILNDDSFQLRLALWYNDIFLEDFRTLMFGKGIGHSHIMVADSLYIKLLVGIGSIGLLIYLSLIVLFARQSFPLFIFCVFIVLNGITTETTLNSYRCVQVLIPILIFMLIDAKKGERIING